MSTNERIKVIQRPPVSAIGEVWIALGNTRPEVMYVKEFLSEPFSDGAMKWNHEAVCFTCTNGRKVTASLANCIVIRY